MSENGKPEANLPDWPALRGPLPPAVAYERGIWGKAHGAHSDYRWLARSRDFARGRSQLGRQLNLGLEDRPCVATAWRVVDGACYAAGSYPSRAADAAGRRGFLEKQVLEWHRQGAAPAVAGAFLLLPEVAALDDEVWWSRRAAAAWSDPTFALPIAGPGDRLTASELRLAEELAAGLAELRRSNVGDKRLAELYAAILEGRRPACLRGLKEPLPPRALAALMLPLPRELADRLSLAAWMPSSRGALAELGRNWDVVVCPDGFAAAAESCGQAGDHARRLARALLLGNPEELGKHEQPSPEEPSWDDTTAEMRHDLTRTTDRLIEEDLWHVWRRHARLQPRERLTTALAWLTSEVWSRGNAPAARIDTWNEVLDDIGTLRSAHMKRLCRGGRHTWPWIPPHQRLQLADLSAMASSLGDLVLLAESIEPEMAERLDATSLYRNVLLEFRFGGH